MIIIAVIPYYRSMHFIHDEDRRQVERGFKNMGSCRRHARQSYYDAHYIAFPNPHNRTKPITDEKSLLSESSRKIYRNSFLAPTLTTRHRLFRQESLTSRNSSHAYRALLLR